MAAPSSGVIIDIKKDTNGQGSITYPSGVSPNQVRLEKSEDPASSGFWKFTHKPPSEDSFTVAQVVFGSNTVSDIGVNPSDNIQHLSVWYWKGDQGMTNPLLAEVLKDGNYAYNYNKGGGDIQWSPAGTNPLTGKTLETQLDGLNCKLNDAVTINLTFQNSSTLSETHAKNSGRKDNKYCCDYHNPNATSGRVSVTIDKVRCKEKGHKSADCYKHTIDSGGYKLAKIKYNGRDRKNIKGPELNFPIKGPVSVYVLYCNHNPVLIYVKGDRQNKWYQKPASNGATDEQWTEVGNLGGITPENSGNLGCREWNELINYLRDCGLKECPQDTLKLEQQPPPPPPPLSGGAGPEGAVTSDVSENGNGIRTGEDSGGPDASGVGGATAAQGQEALSSRESSQIFPGDKYVFGGLATVVSGLIGLAGFKYYRSYKGDPWVRQI